MPALARVVTNQSCLVKQRRAVSDLNLVGGISARGYEGAGAGEECQCQFSHVHLLSVEAPSSGAPRSAEEVRRAEINKLSGGKVLDKLRSNDAPKRSKILQLDES
jgi:hypothetical protein